VSVHTVYVVCHGPRHHNM